MSLVPGTDRQSPPPPGVKLTYDDFLLFPDDGLRHELIDGEHYVTPSPSLRHQRISGNIYTAIRTYLREHPIGEIFYAPLDVVLSNVDVVEPDLLYVARERAGEVLTSMHVRGVPNLVVEIGSKSTSRRDDTIKRRLYERSGVDEYWIVDPATDTIRVFRHADDRFAPAIELRRDAGHTLTTPLLPGFTIELTAIFPPDTSA
ncbi:MAG: hypothetical protein ABS36_13725 [Acidobacteria bacterium SCN 69-37]|nr:MAG: hypothetical protein ABS36_13725 [Acidobacteria bacterium SCN 69-37]